MCRAFASIAAMLSACIAHAAGPVVKLERVSVMNSGAQSGGDSLHAVISRDGRLVAFDNSATNLATGVGGSTPTGAPIPAVAYPFSVYVRDRAAGTTELVSVATSGTAAGASYYPSISADGRYVAFGSLAGNLVAGDTNGIGDVFVRDRLLGTTVRASVNYDGTDTAGGGDPNFDDNVPTWLSANGRYVVFFTYKKLTANATNAQPHVYRRDLVANVTELVDVTPAGAASAAGGDGGSISADGRYVVFRSYSNDIVVGANPFGNVQLFVRDMNLGVTSSLTPNASTPGYCASSTGQSTTYNLTGNGRYAAFESYCTDLAPGQDPADRLFLRDFALGTTRVLRINDSGLPGGNGAYPSASNSGRHAVAWTQATNVVPGDTDVYADVFLHDSLAARTYRISQRADNGDAPDENSYSPLIGEGGHVVFASDATNLVDGDTNGMRDIFVATLDAIFADGFQ